MWQALGSQVKRHGAPPQRGCAHFGQRPGGEDDQRRVAVFDLDGADGLHVLYVVQWVNEFTNILPDLS